jgi:hypothetical protein
MPGHEAEGYIALVGPMFCPTERIGRFIEKTSGVEHNCSAPGCCQAASFQSDDAMTRCALRHRRTAAALRHAAREASAESTGRPNRCRIARCT